ncbi:MAG TPA: DciA family protein [Candidatus Limnocylindrales bacterium]|nr:DciA family protein [Candidatus Limnocylindrales bacterium]
MKPLARVLDRALRSLGMDRDVARADAVRAWSAAAASVLGADASGTRAVRAEGDTLVVTVPTAAWAGEIRLRERELITALGQRAPQSGITRVRTLPSSTPRRSNLGDSRECPEPRSRQR